MAVMLEKISNITVIARTTISAVYRTAQIVASMPNLSYQTKARTLFVFSKILFCISSEWLGVAITLPISNRPQIGSGSSRVMEISRVE